MSVLVKDRKVGRTKRFSDNIYDRVKDEKYKDGKRFVKTGAPAEVKEAKNTPEKPEEKGKAGDMPTEKITIDGNTVEMTHPEILAELQKNKINFMKNIGLPKAAKKLQDALDAGNKAETKTEEK